MKFNKIETDKLLSEQSITDLWPWCTENEQIIDKHIKRTIATIKRKLNVKDKTEFNHYGSGYANYVDCWLYRENDSFRYDVGNHFHGLVILFSRLSNYYVIGEGTKSWNSNGTGGSYLPSFEFIDNITHLELPPLASEITILLKLENFSRLKKHELSDFLNAEIEIPTILCDPPFRNFDLLFHWED